jgi:hypothetical protein
MARYLFQASYTSVSYKSNRNSMSEKSITYGSSLQEIVQFFT